MNICLLQEGSPLRDAAQKRNYLNMKAHKFCVFDFPN